MHRLYRRNTILQAPGINSLPYGSEKARPLFGMSCESIENKKKIALSNVLLFRMSCESNDIDIKRSIAPSNVP